MPLHWSYITYQKTTDQINKLNEYMTFMRNVPFIDFFFFLVIILLFCFVVNRLAKAKPHPWETAWLLSIIPVIVGLASLPKNNIRQMNVCAGGILLMGVGPLVYGACTMIQDIYFNISRGRAPATQAWQNAPMKMAAVAFVIQFHGISLYYANKLNSAWSFKGEKKTS